jgi:hypothetical protein
MAETDTTDSSWWDTTKDKVGTWLDSEQGSNAKAAAASYFINKSGFTDEEIKRSGYQGSVPDYKKIMERVNYTDSQDRGAARPGAMGRRYFSDTRYLKNAGGASGIESTPQKLYEDDTTIYTKPTIDYAGGQIAKEDQDADKTYTEEGYLSTPGENPQVYGNNYTDEGRAIETMAQDYSNQDIASGIAANQARGFAQGYSPYMAAGGKVSKYNMGGMAASPYAKREEEDSANFNMGGGVRQLAGGRYLNGMTDGMADEVPSSIDGVQPAALSDGEFVVPADVVSHLGNGSSNAGAKVLDDMMSNVRETRTGNPKQGKEIDAKKVLAQGGIANAYAHGGKVRKFAEGDLVTAEPVNVEPMNNTTDANTTDNQTTNNVVEESGDGTANTGNATQGTDSTINVTDTSGLGKQTGAESSLSNWVGDTVTGMIGRGEALVEDGYQAYKGPLTAGINANQQAAFDAGANIDTSGSGLGSFGDLAQTTTYNLDGSVNQVGRDQYMNPYLQGSLAPQLRVAQEEAARQMAEQNVRAAQSGSFGGSRNAIMNAMLQRDSAQQQADITAQGYNTAFDNAQKSFGEDRQFGLDALQRQSDLGATERDIYSESVAAAKDQFEEERDFDWNANQYISSLLQGLPVEAQNYNYSQPSDYADITALYKALGGTGGASDVLTGLVGAGTKYGADKIADFWDTTFGGSDQTEPDAGDTSANQNTNLDNVA